ncbi:MAG: histidyl-tRNA synthetase [Paenibacillus sp.]|jgi:histidyl-tRNA synthetase|nr:histidyl-tRNA synthetase [Paenibacillus sp.]
MQNVKGTYDYFGAEQVMRKQVRAMLEKTFELYDFSGMETTILNGLELLTSKYTGGEEIVREMYQLTDQGNRSLGLRYDLTIPFAKVVALNPGLAMPYKRYEIGKVFRDGPVKRGRMREFMQCDADIVGISGPEAEAEFMQLAIEVFRKLDIPIVIRWNNVRFLGEILDFIGVPDQDKTSVMLTLDKMKKVGTNDIKQELIQKGIKSETIDRLLELIDLENPTLANVTANYGVDGKTGVMEVLSLQNLIQQTGLEACCVFDPFLSRGLTFYTGTVYEIFDASLNYTSSLGSGGRYDAIIGQLGGREDIQYPCVGISFGMESIMEMIRNRPILTSEPSVVVISIGETIAEVLAISAKLRAEGFRTRTETSGRKLKKSLAAAASKEIRFILLVGEDESKLGKVRLKDMSMNTESVVTVQEAIHILSKNILSYN